MEQCPWCYGALDPMTRRCQQCGRFPAMPPLPASVTGQDSTYLQLGLGRGEGYLDFDLEIGQGQRGVYPLQVLRSPRGVVFGQLHFPFDEPALKQTLLELQNALLRASQPRRHVVSPEDAVVQRFGQSLFEALFTQEVRRRYRLSQEVAAEQGKGLRLRLHLLAPDLAVVPWEYLYHPERGDYLCLSRTTPLVRYLDLPQHPEPLSVSFPLRILGMIASPSDQDALDTAGEQQRVEAALRRLRERGLVELVWLKGQTWRDLQRAMRGGPWHIFHFIGHGGFDPQAEEGVLALSNEEGTTHLLRATELARLLATQQALRLVLLNACEGARASAQDRFSSTAAALARRGIPAVVAMQYAITDRAATEWTRAFYEAVADGLPVDAAVAEARTAISLAVPHTLEWGTPVLYLQAPDGVLFTLPEASRPLAAASARTGAEWLAAAQAAHRTGRLQEALAAYDEALRLAPNDPATARGKAAVLHSLQQAAPPAAVAPAPVPSAPVVSGPPMPAPYSSLPQSMPPAQQVSLTEQGAALAPTYISPPSPVQSMLPAQTSMSAMGPVVPGLSPPSLSAPSTQVVPASTGTGASRPPTPSAPLSRKRYPLRKALVAVLVLLVLASGSLGGWGLTGHGPLAALGKARVIAPTQPAPATPHPAGIITEFAVPTAHNQPFGIAAGPDGNLWFTECALDSSGTQCTTSKIGSISSTGKITEFPLPMSTSGPTDITAGPDGNLWFTEEAADRIGRSSPTGKITEFPLADMRQPGWITAGPDGNLWFTELQGKIGSISPTGKITEFPLPDTGIPERITAGPDGNLWFTEVQSNRVGQITPTGKITEFPLPDAHSQSYGITAGPDGNLWFTECVPNSSGTRCDNSKIGRISSASKQIAEFSLPNSGSSPGGIATGPDGNLWFTEYVGNKIGRITPAGSITEFSVLTSNSRPYDITAGPGGTLWFTERNADQIGRITSGK